MFVFINKSCILNVVNFTKTKKKLSQKSNFYCQFERGREQNTLIIQHLDFARCDKIQRDCPVETASFKFRFYNCLIVKL